MTVMQWVLIGLVVVLIVAYPFIMRGRNKKEQERLIEQTNSLKRGDKILTTSGVYGTVIEVREEDGAKKVVIETGNAQYKSYMSIDAYAVYTVLKDEKKVEEPKKVEEKKADKKEEVKEEKVEEKPEIVETKAEKTAEKKPAKKASTKKTTKKEAK